MDRENVAKLIAALRSGQYRQGRGRLRTTDDYCCLGVACDLSGLGTWEYSANDPDGIVYKYVVRNENGGVIDDDEHTLPSPVGKWIDLDDAGNFTIVLTNPSFTLNPEEEDRTYETFMDLAGLNDDDLTFDQIADLLEFGPIDWNGYYG